MKRVLSFFLCLALLCSTVMLLASCSKGKDGEPKVSSKVVDVDLTDYSVIYASDLSSDGRSQVNDMATQLSALTALKIRPNIDGESDAVKTDDLEILIGETNRSETVKTLKSLGDLGWAIRVFDNKIVIVGTNNFMTRVALAYFTRNYLNTDSVKSTVLSLNKKVTAAKLESLSFTDEEGLAAYSVIFDDRLDITTGSDYGSEPAGATVDYPFTVVEQVRSNLASLTGLRANNFAIQNDTVAATEKEILVGDLDRTEMQEVLADMSAKDYGIVIRNSKIMVAAWNDVTLARAAALFKSMLTDATEADEEGNTTTLIPTNCSMVLTMTSDWVTDFPRPEGEGITLSGTVDVNDNSIEYVYSGTGINRDSYVAYCQTLEAAGFKTIAAETQMEGSSFRTYLNENTGVTLQVSHYAYTHAASQKVTNFENCFRIVASTTEDVTLPSADILSPKSYTYMTETMVTSVAIQYRTDIFGMCYIITLE
ncbi:MAG: hypothetical protein IJX39_01150, partial [Clostridia bacterium]|nr:hypothetical protein [Clostridia bacterium]